MKLLLAVSLCLPVLARAQDATPIGVVGGVVGKVHVLRGGDRLRATKGLEIYKEDQLVTGKNSVAKIIFADGSSATATDEGSVEIEEFRTLSKGNKLHLDSAFSVISGKVRFFVKPREGGHSSTVRSQNAVMGVRGTTFYVDAVPLRGETRVFVETGKVAVTNVTTPGQEVLLVPGEGSLVAAARPAEKNAEGGALLVAQMRKAESSLAEPLAEGTSPEGLELPPPQAHKPPATPSASAPSNSAIAQGQAQTATARQESLLTTTVLSCHAGQMAVMRALAQELDPGALEVAAPLLPCEGYAHEAVFWTSFLLSARGAPAAIEDAVRLARPEDLALDLKSPRRAALEEALKGNVEPVRRLNASTAAKKNAVPDRELLLTEARTLVRLQRPQDALKVYDTLLRLKTLEAPEPLELERAYASLLVKSGTFDETTRTFRRLLAARDPEVVASAQRGLTLARRGRVPLLAPRDDAFTLQASLREDLDDRQSNGARLKWSSSLLGLGLASGSLRAPRFDSTPQLKTAGTAFWVWRDFTLSSGTTLGAQAGLFHAGTKDRVFFEARGAYRFGFGGRVSGSYASDALAREGLVDAATLGWRFTRLALGLAYEDWVSYRFTRTAVETFEPASRHAVEARVPLHRGETALESIVAEGSFALATQEEDIAALASPRKETSYGAGLAASYPVLRWLALQAGFGFGVASRERWPAEKGLDYGAAPGSRAERRELVENETETRFSAGLLFPFSPVWDAALAFRQDAATDAEGRKVGQSNLFEAKLNWNYGRAGQGAMENGTQP